MEFTAAQRKAIGLDSLEQDTCVVAGPGSGKTTVLIERFRGLVESGVSPLRILAITFTEKATNQMRERLTAAFAGQGDLSARIRRAWVSTVHGFCTRLLRENAILAGVDPRFRVMNEQEAFALEWKSAVDSLDQFLLDEPARVRALLRSLESADIARPLLDIYDAMRAAGARLSEIAAFLPRGGGRTALQDLAARCAPITSGVFLDWKPTQREELAQVSEWLSRVRERNGELVSIEDLRVLASFNCNRNKLRKNNPTYDLVKQVKEELIPAAEQAVAADLYAPQRATLFDAIARFDALYRSRKAAQSALDFSDLEEFTVRLLEENPEACERIRRQFDHVLMDEFQDTNGLQAKLLDLIRTPGRFYAVGDINQSIYGFRHADPEVFRAYRAGVKRVVELRENWRSRADILAAVTSLVGGREGIEPHELQPARKFSRKGGTCVEVIRILGDEALEAKWVAARIAELRETLAARFGDMAVLVRKADSIRPITNALDEAGISYAVTAGKGFFDSREVTDLTHLLRILANPRDEISLAAVLRSPLVAVSDATLLRLKQSGNLATAMAESDEPAVREFHGALESWRETRSHVSPDRLLIRAMDRRGYELRLTPREQANVEKFINLVRDSRLPLDELVEDLERLRESDPREQDSQADDVGDVVRVLTAHSAKGLEFPVVFLPAMQAGVNRGAPPALLSPALGLGVRWRNPVTGDRVKDSLYSAISQDQRRREDEESNRLLYVAMTRAEERLILSCSGKLANWATYLQSNWGLNLDAPYEGPREQSIGAFTATVICTDQPPPPPSQLSLPLEPESMEQIALPVISGQHDSAATVTSIALFADCPRRYYLAKYLGWEGERPSSWEPDGEDPSDRDPVDATEFGREVHALLAGGPRDGAQPEAAALVARFESSDLGRQVADAGRIEREFDFVMVLEDMVLRGQIDLWFEDGGQPVIVDYKTDDVTAAEAATRAQSYTSQLQLYAIAVQRLTGKAPARALLYFLRPNVAIPVDVSAPALAAAAQLVGEFQQAQDRLDFPLREGAHCLRCPHFHGMCPSRAAPSDFRA